MIIQEAFEVEGRPFTRTYSNDNRYVVRDGAEYEEACDPTEFSRTYEEGRKIDAPWTEEALSILLGGTEI